MLVPDLLLKWFLACSLVSCSNGIGGSVTLDSFHSKAVVNPAASVARTEARLVVTNLDQETAQPFTFTFQLPASALISGLTLNMDDDTLVGVVKALEEARQDYNDAVENGESAGLIESRTSTFFDFDVNVKAGATATFALNFDQLLIRENKVYTYSLPMFPRPGIPDFQAEVEILVDPSAIVSTPDSSFSVDPTADDADKELTLGVLGESPAVKCEYTGCAALWSPDEQDQVPEDSTVYAWDITFDVLRVGSEVNTAPSNVASSLLWDEDSNEFFHFFRGVPNLQRIPLRVVFVLDVSGSMSGDNLKQMKDAFIAVVDSLQKVDSFGVIQFESYATKWPQTAEHLIPASKKNVARAKNYISELVAGGGTNIFAGAQVAMELLGETADGTQNTIVLFTDGHSTTPINTLVDFNQERSLLFSLGFGENVKSALLTELAVSNGGFFQKLYVGSDVSEQLLDFYQKIRSPILADVSIAYDPPIATDTLSRVDFRYLNDDSELIVCGKLPDSVSRMESPMSVHVTAKGAAGVETLSSTVQLQDLASSSALLGFASRACAMLRIEQLKLDASLTSTDSAAAEDAKAYALSLALQHQLVVQDLTALVVVAEGDTSADPAQLQYSSYSGAVPVPASTSISVPTSISYSAIGYSPMPAYSPRPVESVINVPLSVINVPLPVPAPIGIHIGVQTPPRITFSTPAPTPLTPSPTSSEDWRVFDVCPELQYFAKAGGCDATGLDYCNPPNNLQVVAICEDLKISECTDVPLASAYLSSFCDSAMCSGLKKKKCKKTDGCIYSSKMCRDMCDGLKKKKCKNKAGCEYSNKNKDCLPE